jgi:hypothetical protein
VLRRIPLVLVGVLALAGCGNSHAGDEQKIRHTVEAFLGAYAAGDAQKACSLLNAQGWDRLFGASTRSGCEATARRQSQRAGAKGRRQLRSAFVTRVEFKGDTFARAFVKFPTFDAPAQPLRVVKRGERWLIAGPARGG